MIDQFTREKLKLFLRDHPLIISMIKGYLKKRKLKVYLKNKRMIKFDQNSYFKTHRIVSILLEKGLIKKFEISGENSLIGCL